MRVVKQKLHLPISNQDHGGEFLNKNRKHGQLLPNSIRAIICGPSASGKTNVMLSLLLEKNGLRFENVYVYSKSLHQPKYIFLKKVLKQIKGMGYFTFEEHEDVLNLSNVRENSIFIFDDVACHQQNKISIYFSMGRHKGIDCFYLCQSYAKIPKHLIRDNVNLLVIFKQDDLNLKHIYDDHVNTDMSSFNQFKNVCMKCWNEKYGCLVIMKDCEKQSGRYRLGFDKYIKIGDHDS